jgi:hypothetical protein
MADALGARSIRRRAGFGADPTYFIAVATLL